MGEVGVFPRFAMCRLVLKFESGEVAEAGYLVFDGRGEEFDVAEEEVWGPGW